MSMHSQLPTGTILGVVKDSGSNAIVGANVTVCSDQGVSRSFTTDATGSFRFPALPVGKYAVTVSQIGFKMVSVKDMTLTVGQEAVLNFELEVGSVSESVEVKSDVLLVNTTSSSLGGLVSENTIADLPLNGRNYVDLTLLQPGITQQTQENAGQGITGTIYSSDGAPIRSNNVMLDGTLTTSATGLNASSEAGTTLGMDGVREYKVVTNLASADFYSGMGGQTSIVSRSGTNQLAGDIFEYLRNSSLDANNYFDVPAILEGKRIPEFRRNQFGGALGGPLQKDKTFFFANYEGLRQVTGNPLYVGVDTVMPQNCYSADSGSASGDIGGAVPSWRTDAAGKGHQVSTSNNPCAAYPPPWAAMGIGGATNITPNPSGPPTFTSSPNINQLAIANLYPYPNVAGPDGVMDQYVYGPSQGDVENAREDFGQIRIDRNFSTNDTGFVRYTVDDTNLGKPDPYPQFYDTNLSRSQFLTLAENHVFSSTLLNSTRLSYARTTMSTITLPANATAAAAIEQPGSAGTSLMTNTSNNSPDCPGGTCMIGLIVGSNMTTMGPSTVAPGYLNQNLYSLGDDVYWTKGRHALKIGFLTNYYDEPMWTFLIFGSVNVMPSTFTAGNPSDKGDDFGDSMLQGYAVAQSFGTPTTDAKRDYTYWAVGGYVQDDWRTTLRLTLNMGLRYEPASVPSDKKGKNWGLSNVLTGDYTSCSATTPSSTCVAQKGQLWVNPTLKNFSPRVGFAWDVQGNGETAVRGGYGVYYDVGGLASKLTLQAVQTPPLGNASMNVFANYAPVGPPDDTFIEPGPPFWPFVHPHNNFPTTLCTSQGTGSYTPGSTTANIAATCQLPFISGNDYNPKSTYLQQYNLSIQRQLPGRMALSAAYVGSRGIHISRAVEGNPVIPCNMPNSTTATNDPLGCAGLTGIPWNSGKNPVWDPNFMPDGAPLCATQRVNPNISAWGKVSTDGDSYYNALQTALARQMSKGLQFQVAFTWSKLQDTTQGVIAASAEGSDNPSDPFNSSVNKGPTAFDAKLNLRANMVYNIPVGGNVSGLLGTLVKGWVLSNIVDDQTGYPFSCMESYGMNTSDSEMGVEDVGADLSNDRCGFVTSSNLAAAQALNPNAVPYSKLTVIQRKVTQWFNPNMFTTPTSGHLGDTPRGLMRGPGQVDWDLSMVKNTHVGFLGEKGNFQFRAEIFNILNHANLAFPFSNNYNTNYDALVSAGTGTTVNTPSGPVSTNQSPTAGQITNTLLNARQIQFATKFEF